jgi:CRP-like cAMP-binding protein
MVVSFQCHPLPAFFPSYQLTNCCSMAVARKQKAGIFDPDLPVLPEFMVHKIGDKVKAQKFWNDAVATQDGRKRQADDVSSQSTQWQTLSAKLRALVSMERHWGALHDIYETRTESLFDEIPLGICVRDPDSQFSTVWDLSAVTMLVYVTITVPLRACFDIDMCLWSAGFWIDAIVDLFFIVDVFVNLRTSFYDRNGFRENRPSKMARNYMKGWFTIDVISCLPVGYVQYFVQTECSSGTSDNYKVVKTLRLLKMSKMLRLARVKRILARYGSDVNYQQYFNIGMTLFTILLLTHLLACVFYLIGEGSETLNNGQYVAGWVEQEENWWEAGSQNMSLAIALSAKYSTSMYYVLNALDDNGFTTTERSFGVMAEFCRDLILGLVASLITTIQMSMNSNDDEKSQKLKRLRTWMQTKRLPKAFQSRAMEHFNELWNNQSSIDLTEILDQCPPAMASNMSELLYGRFLSTVPIFHGLSPQVIGALCMRCKSLLAMKNQHNNREGEPGKEMYMVMGGEVEVSEARDGADQRLGFLSEGAFFGEAPVLGFDEVGLELRTRSVRAVTDTELCYLTRDDVQSLCVVKMTRVSLYRAGACLVARRRTVHSCLPCSYRITTTLVSMRRCADYPELNARIRRFGTAGLVVNDKRMRKVGITRKELETFSSECASTPAHASLIWFSALMLHLRCHSQGAGQGYF